MNHHLQSVVNSLIVAIRAGVSQGRFTTGEVRIVPGAIEIDTSARTFRLSHLPNGALGLPRDVWALVPPTFDEAAFFDICATIARHAPSLPATFRPPPSVATDGGVPGATTRRIVVAEIASRTTTVARFAASAAMRIHDEDLVASWRDGSHGFRAVTMSSDTGDFLVCVSTGVSRRPSSCRIVDVSDAEVARAAIDTLKGRGIPKGGIAVQFSPDAVVAGGPSDVGLVERAAEAIERRTRELSQKAAPLPLVPRRSPTP